MNSAERIQFSQYLTEQHYIFPSGMPKVGYEQALQNLYTGVYSQAEFESEVARMQTMNTDWFDILCHNSFSHDHSVSVTGGSEKVRYYTSIGYTDQDDVIKNTTNRRYTAMAKIDMDLTPKLKLQMNVNGYLNKRQYAQDDNNPIDYAYNTSRAIPAYNADGSYYRYLKSGTQGYYGYSILNELDNSSVEQQTDAVTATLNLRWQTTEDLFFNGVFSANIQNSNIEGWWGDDTFYASSLRRGEKDEEQDSQSLMPYGGELQSQTTKTVGWTARLQGNYNKYFGDYNHNINIADFSIVEHADCVLIELGLVTTRDQPHIGRTVTELDFNRKIVFGIEIISRLRLFNIPAEILHIFRIILGKEYCKVPLSGRIKLLLDSSEVTKSNLCVFDGKVLHVAHYVIPP
jgi:hypothetical protein